MTIGCSERSPGPGSASPLDLAEVIAHPVHGDVTDPGDGSSGSDAPSTGRARARRHPEHSPPRPLDRRQQPSERTGRGEAPPERVVEIQGAVGSRLLAVFHVDTLHARRASEVGDTRPFCSRRGTPSARRLAVGRRGPRCTANGGREFSRRLQKSEQHRSRIGGVDTGRQHRTGDHPTGMQPRPAPAAASSVAGVCLNRPMVELLVVPGFPCTRAHAIRAPERDE